MRCAVHDCNGDGRPFCSLCESMLPGPHMERFRASSDFQERQKLFFLGLVIIAKREGLSCAHAHVDDGSFCWDCGILDPVTCDAQADRILTKYDLL